jgi:hypothetical protein
MRLARVLLIVTLHVTLTTAPSQAEAQAPTCSLRNQGWEEWCPANDRDLFGRVGARVRVRNGPNAGDTCFVARVLAVCGRLSDSVFEVSRAGTGTGGADSWILRPARAHCERGPQQWSCGPISVDAPADAPGPDWGAALRGFAEGFNRYAPPSTCSLRDHSQRPRLDDNVPVMARH